ncbi:MAG TPA: hypothetical protein VN281_21670, partial [Verrucomicrobiae bacterium]|nr:hypothetical protein [Verrucomicrobiae bacterium]
YSNYGTIFRLDIDPAPTVDLVAGRLIVATNALTFSVPFPTVELIWSVTNQGTSLATGGWWDHIWLSTNGVLDTNSVLLGSVYDTNDLPAGEVFYETNTFIPPIPPFSLGGNFSLFLQVNATESVFESNYVNNLSAPIPVSFPDLVVVSAMVTPANVYSSQPNPTVEVTWTVTNQGSSPAIGPWNDTIWLSMTNGYLLSLGYFPVQGPLAPGASYSQTNSVQLPLGASGNYMLFVESDPHYGAYQTNGSNGLSAPLPVAFDFAPPDLAILWASAPRYIFSGSPVTLVSVTWAVTNQGLGTAPGGWNDSVFFWEPDPVYGSVLN